MEEVIEEIKKECRSFFEKYKNKINDAHNWSHTERVRRTALKIADLYKIKYPERNDVNKDEIEIAALLHDIGRFRDDEGEHAEWSYEFAKKILKDYKEELPGINIERILKIVRNHSFHKKEDFIDQEMYNDVEFKIVTDADKIDSLGQIGILRAPLDDRFNSMEKQIKHIMDKVEMKDGKHKYPLRTEEGNEIGEPQRNYLRIFLRKYEEN